MVALTITKIPSRFRGQAINCASSAADLSVAGGVA
jgi:hypothetical protein